MTEHVVLTEFSSRADAESVRELLVAFGVSAHVVSDDCGSVDPALSFARGVQVLVDERDADRAREIVAQATAHPLAEDESIESP